MSSFRDSYELLSFNDEDSFKGSLEKAFNHPNARINQSPEDKQHFKYLVNYLFSDPNGLKVKVIIVEKNYISLSYLSDYVHYYAHCYDKYVKECVRVHFFREEFDERLFEEMIIENKHDKKWKTYAGNIVIKPLPNGYIGETLLSPYDFKKNRHYTAVKKYSVNLFGRSNTVTTLRYQEQDGVVGSCASSALWFAFQKANQLFGTLEPSPSDITISAGLDYLNSGRNFPNTQMDIEQVGKAIYANGLVSEALHDRQFLSDNRWMKAFIYAYLKMGIPILHGIKIEGKGQHLITLNGYRLSDNYMETNAELDRSRITMPLASDDITKFYAHDDQIGPFTRMEFINDPELDVEDDRLQFNTSWWKELENDITLRAATIYAIIPLKNSIRVTFRNILDQAVVLSFVINKYIQNGNFKWDIFLQKSNSYKEELATELIAIESSREIHNVLFQSLPQYVWVIKAYGTKDDIKTICFDFIYDAGDVNYKNNPFITNIYDDIIYEALLESGLMPIFEYKHEPGTRKYLSIFNVLLEEESMLKDLQNLEDKMRNKQKLENIDSDKYLELLEQEDLKEVLDGYLDTSISLIASRVNGSQDEERVIDELKGNEEDSTSS